MAHGVLQQGLLRLRNVFAPAMGDHELGVADHLPAHENGQAAPGAFGPGLHEQPADIVHVHRLFLLHHRLILGGFRASSNNVDPVLDCHGPLFRLFPLPGLHQSCHFIPAGHVCWAGHAVVLQVSTCSDLLLAALGRISHGALLDWNLWRLNALLLVNAFDFSKLLNCFCPAPLQVPLHLPQLLAAPAPSISCCSCRPHRTARKTGDAGEAPDDLFRCEPELPAEGLLHIFRDAPLVQEQAQLLRSQRTCSQQLLLPRLRALSVCRHGFDAIRLRQGIDCLELSTPIIAGLRLIA
mmetsp:Transcript_78136/g.140993  ORF Transcript_78136/g.140993 Transcript_78136/m.140993 type:complete len:295 (+) Transcript_78136:3-887(+)